MVDLPYERAEDRPTAPEPLDRVQEFINTCTHFRATGGIRDDIATPAELRDWLSRRGLITKRAAVDEDDLKRAVALREGLRALFARHNDASVADDADALRALDEVAAELPLRVSVGEQLALRPVAEQAVDMALAALLADVVAAPGEILSRLKTCRDTMCRWVFYDASRNRSGTWCAMGDCGAAAKKRQFTERRRQRRR